MFSFSERANKLPAWLANIDATGLPLTLPLKEVLDGSFYYPACGDDGSVVAEASGYTYSFVYVDYSTERSQLLAALTLRGFRGYHVLARRSVRAEEFGSIQVSRFRDDKGELNTELARATMAERSSGAYAEWIVFERDADRGPEHGADRFSLLYMWADGVAAYVGLYNNNGFCPKGIAIIQPGTGFGRNWTDFRDPTCIFYQNVMNHPDGLRPLDLLHGGIGSKAGYEEPIWPEFTLKAGDTKRGDNSIVRWKVR